MTSLARMIDPVRRLIPNLGTVSHGERLRACVGALLGLLITGLVSHLALGTTRDLPLLIAPMGASAVLLFAVPASPLAQPWSIVGGNSIAALVGITCARFIPDPVLAASIACACAIGAMLVLRCLHPPSGAVALTAVLGGPAIHASGYGFAISPVGLNSLLLLGAALVFNNITGRRYPHLAPRPVPANPVSVDTRDIDRVLRQHDEVLDIDREDLRELVQEVEDEVRGRREPPISCEDIMRAPVASVSGDTDVEKTLTLLAEAPGQVLMVTSADGRLVGLIDDQAVVQHLRSTRTGRRTAKLFERSIRFGRVPETAADLMQAPDVVVSPHQAVDVAAALMIGRGVRALPVVDAMNAPMGLIDQRTLLAVLYRRDREPQPRSSIQRL